MERQLHTDTKHCRWSFCLSYKTRRWHVCLNFLSYQSCPWQWLILILLVSRVFFRFNLEHDVLQRSRCHNCSVTTHITPTFVTNYDQFLGELVEYEEYLSNLSFFRNITPFSKHKLRPPPVVIAQFWEHMFFPVSFATWTPFSPPIPPIITILQPFWSLLRGYLFFMPFSSEHSWINT